jgi:hypothetical protein
LGSFSKKAQMSKSLAVRSITRLTHEKQWQDAKEFLNNNPNFSSCQVFSLNKESTYFLVKNNNQFYRYTMRNGTVIQTLKD